MARADYVCCVVCGCKCVYNDNSDAIVACRACFEAVIKQAECACCHRRHCAACLAKKALAIRDAEDAAEDAS